MSPPDPSKNVTRALVSIEEADVPECGLLRKKPRNNSVPPALSVRMSVDVNVVEILSVSPTASDIPSFELQPSPAQASPNRSFPYSHTCCRQTHCRPDFGQQRPHSSRPQSQ